MARRQNRSTNRPRQHEDTEFGLIVSDIKEVEDSCKRAICKALGMDPRRDQSHLGFDAYTARQPEGNIITRRLVGPGAMTAQAKYQYKVLRVLEVADRQFWLTVELEFCELSDVRKYRLQSAGFLVFEGEAFDNEKTLVLRGEWGCTKSDFDAQHAHPHWHVYPRGLRRTQPAPAAIFDDPQVVDFTGDEPIRNRDDQLFGGDQPFDAPDTERILDRLPRFHFAMASQWHEGVTEDCRMTLERLSKWLELAISYTLQQLRYLCQRNRGVNTG